MDISRNLNNTYDRDCRYNYRLEAPTEYTMKAPLRRGFLTETTCAGRPTYSNRKELHQECNLLKGDAVHGIVRA
jgi:hypothetical protein